jgi:hypothetical protein
MRTAFAIQLPVAQNFFASKLRKSSKAECKKGGSEWEAQQSSDFSGAVAEERKQVELQRLSTKSTSMGSSSIFSEDLAKSFGPAANSASSFSSNDWAAFANTSPDENSTARPMTICPRE